MILDALLGALFWFVEFVIDAFPDDDFVWPSGAGLAAALATAAGPADSVVPVSEIAATLEPTLQIIAPVIVTARLSLWLYFLTPVIK